MTTHWMPWGKHKGTPLEEVPTDYLVWVAGQRPIRPGWLRGAVDDELRRRRTKRAGTTNQRQQSDQQTGVVVADAIRRVFNRLALAHHPDRGGSDERMRVVNEAHQMLREELRL